MKYFFYFLVAGLVIGMHGCAIFKNSTDRRYEKYVTNHPADVKEAARYAIERTYNEARHEFELVEVEDPAIQAILQELGPSVSVAYDSSALYEIRDSVVTFKRIGLTGVTEVMYDFAYHERTFEDKKEHPKDYIFEKLADRIYYRRRRFPMM